MAPTPRSRRDDRGSGEGQEGDTEVPVDVTEVSDAAAAGSTSSDELEAVEAVEAGPDDPEVLDAALDDAGLPGRPAGTSLPRTGTSVVALFGGLLALIAGGTALRRRSRT